LKVSEANELSQTTSLQAAQLQKEAAELKRDAEALRQQNLRLQAHVLELEKVTAPRRITEAQRKKFLEIVKVSPPRPTILIKVDVTVPDGQDFARDLNGLFNEAGLSSRWDDSTQITGIASQFLNTGIFFQVGSNSERLKDADTLAKALALCGIVKGKVLCSKGNNDIKPEDLLLRVTNKPRPGTSNEKTANEPLSHP
jgi:hypothetical protein